MKIQALILASAITVVTASGAEAQFTVEHLNHAGIQATATDKVMTINATCPDGSTCSIQYDKQSGTQQANGMYDPLTWGTLSRNCSCYEHMDKLADWAHVKLFGIK
jgi:hypothetical protein